jgi:hydrogenase nickel incorporation protein HypA/HybF
MSIARSLIDVLREEMISHHVKTLRSVRLNIGQMSAVVPDALSFCFQVITKGTDLEGVKLNMDIVPLMGSCNECGEEFEILDYNFICSRCGSDKINTIGGKDLSIVEMEVDEPVTAG